MNYQDRYNSERYLDMTAYLALRNIERKERRHSMKEDWIYRRGDVYLANLDPYIGSEQGGTRPVVVLQNNTGNFYCPTLIIAPMPPVANANYAWILHMLSKLDVSHGIAGFLLANGALNADDAELTLRREIIERDRVEAIIVLPRDMFYTTDISVTLWIINMNKKAGTINGRQVRDRTNEILFMDLRSWDGNIEEIVIDKGKRKKKTVFTDAQIADVKRIYTGWQSVDRSLYSDVPELCKAVKLDGADGIRAKNYSLAPSKYIEFVNHDQQLDAVSLMNEVKNEINRSIIDERETLRLLELAAKEI